MCDYFAVNDKCNGLGECIGTVLKDLCIGKPKCKSSAPGTCKLDAKCQPATGECASKNKPKNDKCDDGNKMTGTYASYGHYCAVSYCQCAFLLQNQVMIGAMETANARAEICA